MFLCRRLQGFFSPPSNVCEYLEVLDSEVSKEVKVHLCVYYLSYGVTVVLANINLYISVY